MGGASASIPTSTLSVGNHTVTAVYSGDSSFPTSTGTPKITQGGLLTGLQSTSTTLKIVRTPNGFADLAVSPDGKRIVTASAGDPIVRIWSADV